MLYDNAIQKFYSVLFWVTSFVRLAEVSQYLYANLSDINILLHSHYPFKVTDRCKISEI